MKQSKVISHSVQPLANFTVISTIYNYAWKSSDVLGRIRRMFWDEKSQVLCLLSVPYPSVRIGFIFARCGFDPLSGREVLDIDVRDVGEVGRAGFGIGDEIAIG